MDFSWTTRQLEFKQEVIDFALRELGDDLAERDVRSEFSRVDWEKCARFGIQGMSVPAEYNGGSDTDCLTAMLAMEAMGYGCRDNGLTFALNAQMWTVQLPIAKFGTEAQKQRYLPGLCAGELLGAHAISEAESGSDVFSMQTRATKCDGGYIIHGGKSFVTLGPVADVALVFATVDPGLGKWGVTAFLVDGDTEGFSAGAEQQKMGLRTVPISTLQFDECFVPEDCRLGPEGSGVSLSSACLEWERCYILASHLGAMEHQLEKSIAYAKSRRQFGKSIGKFQAVANRIVEMKLRLETSRLLLYKVAWLKDTGEPAMIDAALLKLHLSESFAQSSLDAIRVHGGQGYMSATGVERDLRDAVGGTIYAGTSDIQRNIVAALLGL